MIHRVLKEDYTWNPIICACECNKECRFDEYHKSQTCIENALHKLMIVCHEVVNEARTVSTSINNYC